MSSTPDVPPVVQRIFAEVRRIDASGDDKNVDEFLYETLSAEDLGLSIEDCRGLVSVVMGHINHIVPRYHESMVARGKEVDETMMCAIYASVGMLQGATLAVAAMNVLAQSDG